VHTFHSITSQPRPQDTSPEDVVLPTDVIPCPDAIQRIDVGTDRITFTFEPRPAPASLLDCGCLTTDVDVLHDTDACLRQQRAEEAAYDEWLSSYYAGDDDDDSDYLDSLEDCCFSPRNW
jgi:hypothetical protein